MTQRRLLLTLQHRADVRLYTSYFNFAKSCVFNKQSLPPLICHFTSFKSFITLYQLYIIYILQLHKNTIVKIIKKVIKQPFSRSYRIILPSSFYTVISSALVFSTYPPVSVSSTVYMFNLLTTLLTLFPGTITIFIYNTIIYIKILLFVKINWHFPSSTIFIFLLGAVLLTSDILCN